MADSTNPRIDHSTVNDCERSIAAKAKELGIGGVVIGGVRRGEGT